MFTYFILFIFKVANSFHQLQIILKVQQPESSSRFRSWLSLGPSEGSLITKIQQCKIIIIRRTIIFVVFVDRSNDQKKFYFVWCTVFTILAIYLFAKTSDLRIWEPQNVHAQESIWIHNKYFYNFLKSLKDAILAKNNDKPSIGMQQTNKQTKKKQKNKGKKM
jgi:hypothetical protein